jgi:diacylglycerol O-acyltransferase/trehalose O-mycolyltransferase
VIEANAGHACNGDRVVVPRACALVLVAIAVASCGGSHRLPRAPHPGAAGGVHVVAERRVAPRIVDLTIRSRALGTTAKVRLLTPEGWTARTRGRRWPVLYLLHGCCDTYDSWTRSTDVEDLPALRRVLVVMPAGGAVGFYSNWRDGPAWETFHLDELRALLERRYGAGTPRAIAGLSMGGLGAMDYTARHPGMFAAAASYSGVLHPLAEPRYWLGLFSAYTSDPAAVWGDPKADRRTWAAHDPTELAGRLRGARLFVASGNGRRPGGRDPIEATVFGESRAFVARLHALRIPVRTDFYGPGTHAWRYWERDLRRSLPLLLGALRTPR